jgi:putative endonuclease
MDRKPGKRALGLAHEQFAAHWLQEKGLILLRQNYFCRLGEIDLIMRDQDTLVFTEVRYRSRRSHGDPIESVSWRKQRRLWQCARHYLMQTGLYESIPCRFDLIGISPEVEASGSGRGMQVEWIQDAFSRL